MLRLVGGRVESLWDEVLPEKLRELPEDLAQIDGLLRDEALLAPIEAHWDGEAQQRGRSAKGHGRPTIATQTYLRLMVLKHRYGWGYETLMREVSDSLHLRRFCLIPLEEEVPDESTVRKLTRRLGAETVAELSRVLIGKAQRETRFAGAGRADRLDGGGGGRALPDRFGAGGGRGAGARAAGKSGWRRRWAGQRGCATVRARSASGCGRSRARCAAGRARRRQRCWR